ncbi:hypothetical protein FKM82_004046 [Ascaphus truei]
MGYPYLDSGAGFRRQCSSQHCRSTHIYCTFGYVQSAITYNIPTHNHIQTQRHPGHFAIHTLSVQQVLTLFCITVSHISTGTWTMAAGTRHDISPFPETMCPNSHICRLP